MGYTILVVAIYLIGMFGIFGHWLTRWRQQRTASSFKDYMSTNRMATLESILANLVASSGFVSAIPEVLTAKVVITALISAYTAGYMLDSKINIDSGTPKAERRKSTRVITEEIEIDKPKQEVSNEELNDLIASTRDD